MSNRPTSVEFNTRSARTGWLGLAIMILALTMAGCASGKAEITPQPVLTITVVVGTTTGTDKSGEPTPVPSTSEPPSDQSPTPASQPALPFRPEAVEIALEPVFQGHDRPLFVTHPGDGSDRLFVVEKPGRIWVYADQRQSPALFLDIRDRVGSGGFEQGLLGLAFPPDFGSTGAFFVNYTDRNGDTTIARFQVSADQPNQADPASEFLILKLQQPAQNHNGGMLAFGPDGYLYIGTGDGGAANDRFGNGQNPATLLGKMLRIDVTTDPSQPYLIPPDNPWINEIWEGQDVRDEIWALGLRNPWRYSFDRLSNDLWIGDVGQNLWEEIDRVTWESQAAGGLNFGWPIMEGSHCFQSRECDPTGLEQPVAEYDHSQGNCSVTGGYVYRGEDFPALNGVYFYGDFCTGMVWAAWPTGVDQFESRLVLDSDIGISSFGEDQRGELYVTDLAGGGIYRIVARPR